MRRCRLTDGERAHTMEALKFLRIRVGSWKLLAVALGFEKTTLINTRKGVNPISVNMAFSVSRLAGVSFEDVVNGRWPAPGTCPHCGRGPG